MKLLIVDDEELTRTGLISSIDWDSLGITEILQADDGVNGLEMARLYKPEIILCDVRMPRMTGIAMLERLEKFLPDSIPIFMSGYSDKEYLKAAIKLKAVNYIEKPLHPEEVRAAVLEAETLYKQKLRSHRGEAIHSQEIATRLAQQLTLPPSGSIRIADLCLELEQPELLEPGMNFTSVIVKLNESVEASGIFLEDLYARTGIQKAIFNTVYQLMAVKKKHPEYLEQAETLLHVPDYFHFLLTGEKTCEYTEATTGQLVCPTTKDWDYELIDMLGYPKKIFQKLIMPGTSIGHLTDAVKEAVGFDLEVVAPATHDTGSAVLAVPANDDDFIYISSGTWSLMGIERKEADCSEKSCEMNFTNEGGYAGRFRYLKNIMGLWMIQSVRHEFDDAYSFAQICEMAEEAKDFPSRVDANDECFLSPENMTKEVQDYCRRTGQKVPETLGEIATVIYTSLAECYAKIAKELEEMTGRTYSRIHIVGGGSNAGYLNELTAKATKKEIHAGPGEATAIGNITAQMLKAEEFKTIEEARTTIHESFGIKVYKA